METRLPQQTSFLIRLWRSDFEWRISLENPITGERSGFTNLEALVDFLNNDFEKPHSARQEKEENHPKN